MTKTTSFVPGIAIGPGTCSKAHSHANRPNCSGLMRSVRLCNAITATPKAPSHWIGSRTRSAMHIMHKPRHVMTITPTVMPGTNVQAKLSTVNSRNTSHNPRVQKNREIPPTVFPRPSAR
jgi:hypothetical protein